jgi:hypothetical protein
MHHVEDEMEHGEWTIPGWWKASSTSLEQTLVNPKAHVVRIKKSGHIRKWTLPLKPSDSELSDASGEDSENSMSAFISISACDGTPDRSPGCECDQLHEQDKQADDQAGGDEDGQR